MSPRTDRSTACILRMVSAVALIGAGTLAGSRAASAQVLYSNLPNQADGYEMTRWIEAEDFTIGSATTLTGIRFWSIEQDAASYQGSISYNIYANSASNTPGAVLFTGNTSAVTRTPTGLSVLGFAEMVNEFAVSLPLGAGTYWLGLHNGPFSTDTNLGFWWETADANGTRGAMNDMAPFDGSFFATDDPDAHLAFVLNPAADGAANAAPEPATCVLLAAGVLPVMGRVISRRRRKA